MPMVVVVIESSPIILVTDEPPIVPLIWACRLVKDVNPSKVAVASASRVVPEFKRLVQDEGRLCCSFMGQVNSNRQEVASLSALHEALRERNSLWPRL